MHLSAATSSICFQVIFLITGIFTTICNQVVTYSGAGEKSTLLLSVPTYVGMAMVASLLCCLNSSSDVSHSNFRGELVFAASFLDVVSNVLCMVGLNLIGSGLFQVLYATIICFAAVLSRIILKHRLSWLQLSGILLCFVGLVLTSLDSTLLFERSSLPSSNQSSAHGTEMLIGMLVTLLGCLGYAGSYVLNEFILLSSPSLRPQHMCALVGFWGCMLLAIYLGAHTLPHWDDLVLAPMRARRADPATVAALFGSLTASSFLHNLAYFHLLRATGAVSTGVLGALRTIGVFLASGFLFCDFAPVQCLTSQKLGSVLVICLGVLVYALATQRAASHGACETGADSAAGGGGGVELRSAAAAEKAAGAEEGMAVLRELIQGVLE